MRRERFKIALLVLGVVLGYGHAFMHHGDWRGFHEHHCGHDRARDFGHGEHYDRGHATPEN